MPGRTAAETRDLRVDPRRDAACRDKRSGMPDAEGQGGERGEPPPSAQFATMSQASTVIWIAKLPRGPKLPSSGNPSTQSQ